MQIIPDQQASLLHGFWCIVGIQDIPGMIYVKVVSLWLATNNIDGTVHFSWRRNLIFEGFPCKPGPDYCFNFCLYNSTQFWQHWRAHTRVLAFMNLLGCECHADGMNSGHKSQTSTMTLFIQTWLPECRSTLWVINFHRPRTSASTMLIPRRKMHLGK